MMGWVSRDLKVPDGDHSWVSLVEVEPDGTTRIIGYVSRLDIQTLVESTEALADVWNNYLHAGDDRD